MIRYIVFRLLSLIPTLFLVFTMLFFIAHATPGSPWDASNPNRLDPQTKANLDAKYHLDDPLGKQYVDYIVNALHGDLGPSYRNKSQSVVELIKTFFPVSAQLGLTAMVLAILLGLPLGALASLKHGKAIDSLLTALTSIGLSLPSYVVTSVLIVILGVELRLVPTIGWKGLFSTSAIVPVIALSLGPMSGITLYFRASMLEVTRKDYIRTARAKGLRERAVITRHMMRNALIPVLTVIGIYASLVLVGSFFVESIAGVPGMGRYFVLSVQGRDYPVILGTMMVFAVILMIMNLIVDLGYVILDPRVRLK